MRSIASSLSEQSAQTSGELDNYILQIIARTYGSMEHLSPRCPVCSVHNRMQKPCVRWDCPFQFRVSTFEGSMNKSRTRRCSIMMPSET
jgi:hypothetical protein